jgi:Zn finger protein HypA/HybF involved in hydrogenase expression
MTFACKKCKKAFRKDVAEFDESDEYCPHCDNHFVSVDIVSVSVPSRLCCFRFWTL